MKDGGTPLGFLPGVIYPGSHCMLAYNRPDDAYIQSVARYMAAGIASGQMCICVVTEPARSLIDHQMKRLGLSRDSGQFLLPEVAETYLPRGRFDLKQLIGFWSRQFDIARTKWNGLRAFGDPSDALDTRANRLKLLEYEALVNTHMPREVSALCGYHAGVLPRSYLLQAKSLHPYIASSKSMRVNRNFADSEKFLSGLYRFHRVSREYPASLDQTDKICSDLEEITLRTGMTLPDIDDTKLAVCTVFARIVETVPHHLERFHIHLVYDPKPDKFSVTLRYHGSMLDHSRPKWSLPLELGSMDTVHIDESGADTIVTMAKRYWAYLSGEASAS